MLAWAGTHRRGLRRAGIVLAVLSYLALWAITGRMLTVTVHGQIESVTTDLDAFFIPAARLALAGHPFSVYTVRYAVVYPNANGPLSLLPLSALLELATRLGWANNFELRRGLILAGFAPFLLLLAREVVLALDFMRGERLVGWRRLVAYAAVTLSPTNWIALLFYGHIEQPIALWLALLGTRLLINRRAGRAGFVFGLALLTRTEMVLFPLVLVIVLLRGREVRAIVTLALTAVVTLALGLLPFWLADRTDLVYSLLSFRGELPVGAGNVWGLVPLPPVLAFAQRWDSATTLGVAGALVVLVLFVRRDLSLRSPALYDLLMVACLCFPLFIKTLWPYYFFEPWMFAVLWWLAWRPLSRQGWAWWFLGGIVPVAAIAGGALADSWRGVFFAPDPANLWWNWAVSATLLIEWGALLAGTCLRPNVPVTRSESSASELPAISGEPETAEAALSSLPVAPALEG